LKVHQRGRTEIERAERLGRYEVHLDRKLERTLAMLLRLSGADPFRKTPWWLSPP
jgi:hypothetical protein